MDVGSYLLVCLLSSLPGPPGVSIEDAYVQLFPVDKNKCPTIDPVTDISYELYTSENPLQPDRLSLGNDDALQNSHFDFYKPTVLFFHAFFESSSAASALTIRTAYLQRKDHNVILLNARRMEAGPWYLTAARNTRVVGEYTAAFIDYLVSKGLYLPSLHLIGLSLGAQMAGVCGQNVKSGRIARITGLDPAGPLFTKWPRSLKLDKADAEFVDVIHTDAGIFGYPWSIGHVDFWPNQGISPQPGCRLEEVKLRSPGSIIEPLFCSHWRSFMFYAESVVTPDSFASVTCKNWNEYARGLCDQNQQSVNMGFNVDRNARGNYYLATRPASPFSQQTPLPKSNAPAPRQPTLHRQQLLQNQLIQQEKDLLQHQLLQQQELVHQPQIVQQHDVLHQQQIAQQQEFLRQPQIVQQHQPQIAQQQILLHQPQLAQQQEFYHQPQLVQQQLLHQPQVAQQQELLHQPQIEQQQEYLHQPQIEQQQEFLQQPQLVQEQEVLHESQQVQQQDVLYQPQQVQQQEVLYQPQQVQQEEVLHQSQQVQQEELHQVQKGHQQLVPEQQQLSHRQPAQKQPASVPTPPETFLQYYYYK